jgi:hypothetical protein
LGVDHGPRRGQPPSWLCKGPDGPDEAA